MAIAKKLRSRRWRRGALLLVLVIVVINVVIVVRTRPDTSPQTAPVDGPAATHAKGGVVRVAVSSPPELADAGQGGDTLRQLVWPKLFVAQPDGTWRASLVEPGSDRSSSDRTSATFRLRAGAQWSNGAPITVDDLRRSADKRFVSTIDGPSASGTIKVNFLTPFPGWRRLWSGEASVTPPAADVYGGAFVVRSVTSGLETTVVPNSNWYGDGGPFVDEIHLVLTADSVMARQLLETKQVDVVAPVADTVRSKLFGDIAGVKVSRDERTGAWVGLWLNAERVTDGPRKRVLSGVPREQFVDSLLDGESTLVTGFDGTNDRVWPRASVVASEDVGSSTLTLSTPTDEPLMPLLQKSVQRAGQGFSASINGQSGDAGTVRQWLASGQYQLLVTSTQNGPDVCWTCNFESQVGSDLTRRADAGERRAVVDVERTLHDKAQLLPLWWATPLTAYTDSVVAGVRANGYVSSPTWNAEQWWKP